MDVILADMSLDFERDGAAEFGQPGQRARRTEDEIAHAANIDDGPILAGRIEGAAELRDHRPSSDPAIAQCRFVDAWCAWQMATASASAASALPIIAPGRRRRTIICTCSL